MIDAFRYSQFQCGIACESRFLKEDARFVSQIGMFTVHGNKAIGVARTAYVGVVRREVGHNDLAVGVFIREDRPEVASFIEAEKRIAWIHEARA